MEHLRLAVRFEDGLTGDVVLKESHLHGVFEALKNPRVFAEVHCRQGFVEWPGEIDIAPDAMYDEIKVAQAIRYLPPRDRAHLQALADAVSQRAPWGG